MGWQPIDGAAGPPFAADPGRPGTVYGVSRTTLGGLVVSRDSGMTWAPLAGPGGVVTALAVVDGPNPGLLAVTAAGLSRSMDEGATWSATSVTGVTALAAHYLTLFGTRNTTFRSLDGGQSWTALGHLLTQILLDPLHPTRLLAIDQGKVVARDDRGASFGPPLLPGSSTSLARLSGRLLLAGGCGIERSLDGGRTWAATLPCRQGDFVAQVQRSPSIRTMRGPPMPR